MTTRTAKREPRAGGSGPTTTTERGEAWLSEHKDTTNAPPLSSPSLLAEMARERARFTAAVVSDDRDAAREHQVKYYALERERRRQLLSQAAEREGAP